MLIYIFDTIISKNNDNYDSHDINYYIPTNN